MNLLGHKYLLAPKNSGVDWSNSFITRWSIASDTITLPFVSGYTYDCWVDWGDGIITYVDAYNATGATHTYSSTNTFDIKIAGTAPGWSVNNSSSIDTKIIAVVAWGDVGITHISYGFYGCTNLSSLPAGAITGMDSVTSINYMFRDCTSLSSIPSGMFDNMTSLLTVEYLFYSCTFTTIPTDLLKYNTAITSLAGLFLNCASITAVPTDLFRYNTGVTDMSGLFYGCSSLSSLPSGIFDYNTAVTGMGAIFEYCSSLTSLPTDIFKYNTLNESFYSAFRQSGLTSLPTDVFRYNTAVTTFRYAFRNSALVSTPPSLFRYNINVTGYGYSEMFAYCSDLTSVNSNYMFPNGADMNGDNFYFDRMFDHCSSFNQVTAAADFFQTFMYTGITVASFYYVFYYCSGWTNDVPDMWNDFPSVSTTTGAFSGCTNAGNYADIPSGWLGS